MGFSFSVQDNTVWARVSGEMDMQMAPMLRDGLDTALRESFARNLTFDFTDVRFIDSSGLGVVIGRYKRVAERGGRVRIVGANQQVWRILTLSGLAGLMEIEPPNGEVLGGVGC